MATFDSDKAAAIHRDLHTHLPSDPALRVKTLESLAVERGLVSAESIDAWIEAYSEHIGPKRGAAVVARAWTDPAFRERLIADAGEAITEAAAAQVRLSHPDDQDLAFLYGTVFTDGRDAYDDEVPTRNACVFAGRQVDRSPTGSGVSARLALQWTRGEIGLDQPRRFESLTGARFTGTAVEETRAGPYRAVTVEVSGQAHYHGEARFTLEPDDPLAEGFLLD